MKSKKSESIIASDEIDLGKIAAELVFVELKKCYDIGSLFVLGCPGCRTPRSTYSALANLIQKNNPRLSGFGISFGFDRICLILDELNNKLGDEFVLDNLDKVFQTILKAATYEFLYKPNISINIIIKEYLNSSNFFLLANRTYSSTK